MMRRIILLLMAMAMTLVVASGVALALTKVGTNGPDTLMGTNGDDTLVGKGGNDILYALRGEDHLLGGPGKDIVNGTSVSGPVGGDKNLLGGRGNDLVAGGLGSDKLLGNSGNDLFLDGAVLECQDYRCPAVNPVRNHLYGGEGTDVFIVISTVASTDVVSCGGGVDRVLADKRDVVASNCERVFGRSQGDEFFNSLPEGFFWGLNRHIFQ